MPQASWHGKEKKGRKKNPALNDKQVSRNKGFNLEFIKSFHVIAVFIKCVI